MKILLINNNTRHLRALNKALIGHEVEIRKYRPGIVFNDADKDLVILSGGGGEGLEIYDRVARGKLWYQDQMSYVLTSDKPILGICMGFEVIASAYGAKVKQMPELVQGFMKLKTTTEGRQLFKNSDLKQYEAHQWHVEDVPGKDFDVLAKSKTGIEIIRHKDRPLLASQFHPEVSGGSITLDEMISHTLALAS